MPHDGSLTSTLGKDRLNGVRSRADGYGVLKKWPSEWSRTNAIVAVLIDRIAREADIIGFAVTELAPSDDDEAREGRKAIARLEAAIHR